MVKKRKKKELCKGNPKGVSLSYSQALFSFFCKIKSLWVWQIKSKRLSKSECI